MALNKVTYIARTTPVSSQNLNDIQDEIINNTVPKDTGGTFRGNVTIDRANGTTSANGTSSIFLGNNTPTGTAGNSYGRVQIYGKGASYGVLLAQNVTGNRELQFPDASGTIALESNTYQYFGSITNGSSKSYSFPNSYRGLLHISSGSETSGRNGLYSVVVSSTGTVYVAPLVSATTATITKATNKITIAITTINSYIGFIGNSVITETT